MATAQAYNKRDFGQKKRAVTMAITGVEDAAAVYNSLNIQVITNQNDAEELFTKIKTLKNAITFYESCVLQHESWIVAEKTKAVAAGEDFDEKWEDDFTTIYKDFEDYRKQGQAVIVKASGLLHQFLQENSQNPAPTAEIRQEKSRKFTNVLAPEKLEHNANLQTFEVFATKFRAHHDINDLDNYPLDQRRAFLVNLLDDVLANKLKIHFQNQMHYLIFENPLTPTVPSLMGFLKQHFELQDPLLTRRSNYFSAKQKSGESDIQYFERIKKLELEAEGSKIRPEDIFITVLLNGSSNVELKREIVKLGSRPDLDQVEAMYRQYEGVSVIHRAIRPHSTANHEIEDAEVDVHNLSNYRRNINSRLQGQGQPNARGQSRRGRGPPSFRGRQPQPSSRNPVSGLYCKKKKQNGDQCNYLPFWNCYSHSNMSRDQRSKLDQKNSGALKQILETNSVEGASNSSLSIYDVVPANDPLWQDQVQTINTLLMMADEEIEEVPTTIQHLSSGRELPCQFYEPANPSACPRIYVMIANAIDDQPLNFKRCVALPDSGCQFPCIDEWLLKKLDLILQPFGLEGEDAPQMVSASGAKLAIIGKSLIFVDFCGHSAIFEANVVRGLKDKFQLYLGWKEMIDLSILPPTYPAPINFCDYKFPEPGIIPGADNENIIINKEVKTALRIQVSDSMNRWDRMNLPVRNGANMAAHFKQVNFGAQALDDTIALDSSSQDESAANSPAQPELPPAAPQVPTSPTETPNGLDTTFTQLQALEIKASVKNLMEEYNDVFDITNLKSLKGPKMRIVLREDVEVIPNYVNGSRATPYNLLEEANKELRSYLESKIIKPISPGERTRWLNAAMFLPKPNGGVRLVVDLRILNAMAKREVHCFNSPLEILKSIPPNMKFFAVIDAYRGYYQCDLHPDDQDLTAFVLKDFGTFKFTKIPQGYKSSGDHFCKLSDVVIRDVPNCRKLVDDILVFGETEEELLKNVKILFEQCRKYDLTLNPKKTQIGSEVVFGGYVLTHQGIKIDPKRVKAIREFPPLKSVTDVRSFIGLALQFKHHTPELMKYLLPFTALTSNKTSANDDDGKVDENNASKTSKQKPQKKVPKRRPIVWNEFLQQSFIKAKKLMTSLEGSVMAHYDPKRPFHVYTDASRDGGLGWCGIQYDDKGLMRIIECGSCTISDTARRSYSVSELEMLAIVTALKKLRMYCVGNNNMTVLTDHKPLLGILGKSIDKLESTRLCRMVEKVSAYNFKIQYVKGKKNEIADALSRHPVDNHEEFASEFETFHAHSIQFQDSASKSGLVQATLDCKQYQDVLKYWYSGSDIRDSPPNHPARLFKNLWLDLSVEEQLLVWKGRIIIPNNYKKEIMTSLHKSHLGFKKCYGMAQKLYYWPTMKHDLRQFLDGCQTCLQHAPLPPLTPPVATVPAGKMEHFSSDLCEYNGKKYLVQADRFTGYLFVNPMIKTTADRVISVQKSIFNYFGYPKHIRSDNGPPYNSSEYSDFCKKFDIDHQFSDPFHPISNGHAERAVGIGKMIIKKASNLKDLQELVHQYNNAPLEDGLSPCQWMFGTLQKSSLPSLKSNFVNRIDDKSYQFHLSKKLSIYNSRTKQNSKRTRSITPLPIGIPILIFDQKKGGFFQDGVVVSRGNTPFSYVVEDSFGRRFNRNRRHLRPCFKSSNVAAA